MRSCPFFLFFVEKNKTSNDTEKIQDLTEILQRIESVTQLRDRL